MPQGSNRDTWTNQKCKIYNVIKVNQDISWLCKKRRRATHIATWTPELRNPQKVVWPPPGVKEHCFERIFPLFWERSWGKYFPPNGVECSLIWKFNEAMESASWCIPNFQGHSQIWYGTVFNQNLDADLLYPSKVNMEPSILVFFNIVWTWYQLRENPYLQETLVRSGNGLS